MGPIDIPPPPAEVFHTEVEGCPVSAYIGLSFVWLYNQTMHDSKEGEPNEAAVWASENWYDILEWNSPARGAKFMISGHDARNTRFGRWLEAKRGPPVLVAECKVGQVRFYK